ncbi:hypothetical protein [Bradyrhizobium sp. 191]|uniref:hypothetical protein n=1 Tax=Bradyrhizobium sp. 191 TaxID=2782659 RepID=UPI0018D304D3|nr:hypothetical protein [Bradyrhizobium sp. 191]UPJ66109.1 hypothetical protein IVB23_01610 [Bradyrhizobium sp. 191]
MTSVGRISILRKAIPTALLERLEGKSAPRRYRALSKSGNILLDSAVRRVSLGTFIADFGLQISTHYHGLERNSSDSGLGCRPA